MKYSLLLITVLAMGCGSLQKKNKDKDYTFGRFHQVDVKTRGGSTQGPELQFTKKASEEFKKIQASQTKKEKDRAAILAQAGEYKVTFEFIETIGFKNDNLDKPYQSWATEYVFPVADEKDFISLQHILVMQFLDDKGDLSDPMIVKHWRQDWSYEKSEYPVYKGHQTWKRKNHKSSRINKSWTQEVYQVDDSPRYAGHGKWKHYDNMSVWRSNLTNRPLPRREFSVRSDYDILKGYNTVTVTPKGWYHEQENYKVVVDKKTLKPKKRIAKEVGLNTYRRIKDYSFKPGKDYWDKTSNYWASVREKWSEVLSSKKTIHIKKKHEGVKLYKAHFNYAKKLESGEKVELSPKKHASQTIEAYIY